MQKHPGQIRLRQLVPPVFVAVVVGAAALAPFTTIGRVALLGAVGSYALANVAASFFAGRHSARSLPYLPLTFGILHVSYRLDSWSVWCGFGDGDRRQGMLARTRFHPMPGRWYRAPGSRRPSGAQPKHLTRPGRMASSCPRCRRQGPLVRRPGSSRSRRVRSPRPRHRPSRATGQARVLPDEPAASRKLDTCGSWISDVCTAFGDTREDVLRRRVAGVLDVRLERDTPRTPTLRLFSAEAAIVERLRDQVHDVSRHGEVDVGGSLDKPIDEIELPGSPGQVVGSTGMQCPPTPGPGVNFMNPKGLVAAARSPPRRRDPSARRAGRVEFTNAMLILRKTFSSSFASSAASGDDSSTTRSLMLARRAARPACPCGRRPDQARYLLGRACRVAGIDPFGCVRRGRSPFPPQPAALQNLPKRASRGPRERRGLKHDELTLAQVVANELGRAQHGPRSGSLVAVIGVGTQTKIASASQRPERLRVKRRAALCRGRPRGARPRHHRSVTSGHSARPHGPRMRRCPQPRVPPHEGDRQRQAHIAKSDDSNATILGHQAST